MSVDFATEALAAFDDELYDAVLTRPANSTIDASDPAAAPTGAATTYDCRGIAFTYQTRDIDGTRVIKGDYRVVLMAASLSVTPRPGDSISIPPPGSSTPASARVVFVEAVTQSQITIQVRG